MTKYIHYCWFGGKPLPKLAKKCIKSWEKYLPDYKIIEWNESNVDLEECKYLKEAYSNKKWAFVSDYVRTKVLYEMGGIYFDTDMEVTKDISKLLDNETFLGAEDSGFVAVGVWYEKHPKNSLPSELLKFYRSLSGFDLDNMYSYSIPKLITNKLSKCGYKMGINNVQKLNNNIIIYPRDYFYPISYDRQNNIFTDNTCMIHYYDATWVPKWERREIRLVQLFGQTGAKRIMSMINGSKKAVKGSIKTILFPAVLYKRNKTKKGYISKCKNNLDNVLKEIKSNENYLVIYREDWLGTSYATKELFNNTLGIKELNIKELNEYFAERIIKANLDMVVFSAFDLSWLELVQLIKKKNPDQIIKVIWHGSNAVNTEDFDWKVLKNILSFNKRGLINSIAFVKKSMYDFYKEKNYSCEFLMNNITINNKENYKKDKDNKNIKIGVYASGDRWVKNFYNQLSAASMIDNHEIDCIPISSKARDFSNIINANVTGINHPIKRDELLKRIANNDINLYVTFVECAPLLPLESLELGVPCITSNNHHYFENTELEKYLVVDAPDNIIAIKEKIEYALKNKDKIIKLYSEWKKEYNKKVKKSFNDFMNTK